jgi:hypothetical protein
MEPIEALDSLARRARAEAAPETNLDVARILREIRGSAPVSIAPMAWSAAVSAIAASILLAIALHGGSSSSTDPIAPLFNATQAQMP